MEIEIKVPSVGESISEVTIANWLKKDGEAVELDEVICEIESDKATFELTAEADGVLKTIAKEGDTVSVGDKIASIDTEGAAKAPAKEEKKAEPAKAEVAPKAESKAASESYAANHPSPAAQKILDEKGIDAASVNGSGKDGRITKDDAQKASAPAKAAEPAKAESKPAEKRQMTGDRNTRTERMSALRKTIAKHLVEAKNTTAMLTTFNEVDMSAVMDIRKKYKDAFKEKHQIGLGFMSLFTKAVTEAIKDFPAINAQIDGDQVVYHDYVDVGIAVSTPKGLVVPVIRNAESMSLAEIEKAIMDLALRARDGKLALEEMQGGTFTITNGGIFGSLLSTPIINAPQSAILGMHNIVERPVAVDGQVVIRPMMYLAVSYDHRIVDGRESVSFLVKVKQLLEDPYRMLLEV